MLVVHRLAKAYGCLPHELLHIDAVDLGFDAMVYAAASEVFQGLMTQANSKQEMIFPAVVLWEGM